jgi:hypothetical protein
LLLPVVLNPSALYPAAVLLLPVVLEKRALNPEAVLSLPAVLARSACPPEAVLLEPVEYEKSASVPIPVLLEPVAPLGLATVIGAPTSALAPEAVLKLPLVLLKSAWNPGGGVVAAGRVVKEHFDSGGGVVAAGRVLPERFVPGGGVAAAVILGGWPAERAGSHSCVLFCVARVVRGRHLSEHRACNRRKRADQN